jgi:hypothetical protein
MKLFKKKKGLTDEQYEKIAKALKEESPFWGVLETEIFVLLLKTAFKKYSSMNPAESFENLTDEELHEKAREVFLTYDTSSVTQDGLLQLNAVYRRGKQMGMPVNKVIAKAMKMRDKIKWKKGENDDTEKDDTKGRDV